MRAYAGASVVDVSPDGVRWTLRVRDHHIRPTRQHTLIIRRLVNVDVHPHFHDIGRLNLRSNPFGGDGNEPAMEILPDILLFEVRIHPRKRREGML